MPVLVVAEEASLSTSMLTGRDKDVGLPVLIIAEEPSPSSVSIPSGCDGEVEEP